MSVFSKGRVCRGSKSSDLFVSWMENGRSLGPWIQTSAQVAGDNVDEFRETRLEEKVGEHVSPNSLPQVHLPWRWCKAKRGETLVPFKHSCRTTVFPLLKC